MFRPPTYYQPSREPPKTSIEGLPALNKVKNGTGRLTGRLSDTTKSKFGKRDISLGYTLSAKPSSYAWLYLGELEKMAMCGVRSGCTTDIQ